jgi:hypothetical protein
VRAQNLVPNPSFEEYTTCPNDMGQLDHATGWSRYNDSPDYFNECSTPGPTSVPHNHCGYQWPASGSGYAGGLTWYDGFPGTREIMGRELSEPLVSGVPVYLSFKLVATTNGYLENMIYSASGVGMWFRMTPTTALGALPNSTAIHMDAVPLDTLNWVVASGTYTPDQAYPYVVIGGAYDDSLTAHEVINPNGNIGAAYVYIDDVCVSYDPNTCGVHSGIRDNVITALHSYPNPFDHECHLRMDAETRSATPVQVLDALGRVVWQGLIPTGQTELVIAGDALAPGTYTAMARNTTGLGAVRIVRTGP